MGDVWESWLGREDSNLPYVLGIRQADSERSPRPCPRAALRLQLNKTDHNDAEGLAQIMRTGWFRAVHVRSFDAHRVRALLGARLQLVGMVTKLSNHIRGVLKRYAAGVGPLPRLMARCCCANSSTACRVSVGQRTKLRGLKTVRGPELTLRTPLTRSPRRRSPVMLGTTAKQRQRGAGAVP